MSNSVEAGARKAVAARSRFLMILVVFAIVAAFAPGAPFSEIVFNEVAGGDAGFSAFADFGGAASR